jgi:hypothetical protein
MWYVETRVAAMKITVPLVICCSCSVPHPHTVPTDQVTMLFYESARKDADAIDDFLQQIK